MQRLHRVQLCGIFILKYKAHWDNWSCKLVILKRKKKKKTTSSGVLFAYLTESASRVYDSDTVEKKIPRTTVKKVLRTFDGSAPKPASWKLFPPSGISTCQTTRPSEDFNSGLSECHYSLIIMSGSTTACYSTRTKYYHIIMTWKTNFFLFLYILCKKQII